MSEVEIETLVTRVKALAGHVRRRHNPTAELPSVGHESTKEKLTDGAG